MNNIEEFNSCENNFTSLSESALIWTPEKAKPSNQTTGQLVEN
jgi:hypothetical protein